MLSEKWRVKIENRCGSWWLVLQKYQPYENDEGSIEEKWFTEWSYSGRMAWRLTPSLVDGFFVLPRFWFKALHERISIAVSMAVSYVRREEGLVEGEEALNTMATAWFEDALKKAKEAK